MEAEKNERLAALVASALECAPRERAQFLSDVCGDDVSLREEAESLLRFEERARDFIEVPAYELTKEFSLEDASPAPPEEIQPAPIETESIALKPAVSELIKPETVPAILKPAPTESEREEVEIPVLPRPGVVERAHESQPVLPSEKRVDYRAPKFGVGASLRMLAAGLVLLALLFGLLSARRKADEARRERDIAVAELARAERVSSFLERMLSFSNQSVTPVWPVDQKKSVALDEMLDQIAPQAQNELADRPDVRGEVLSTLGSAYASQGQYDAAEKNLRSALKSQIAFYGVVNAQVAETLVELGVLLYRRDKLVEADGLLEKAVAFFRKQEQSHDADFSPLKFANALDYLGIEKFHRGEAKAGRALLEEALWIASALHPKGYERSVLSSIQTNLGGVLVTLGDLKKGEALLRQSLAESRKTTDHPQWEMGTTLQMLGELALAKNEPAEAKQNLLEAEKIYRDTLGEKNMFRARALEKRAAAALLANEVKPAEQLARDSLTLMKECSPENKMPWTGPMLTLSDVLIKDGRMREAEDSLREILRICENQAMRNYAAISLIKVRLSQLFLSQKRFTEAENLAFEAQSEAQLHLAEQDPTRKTIATNLIRIYEKQGKEDAAREVK